MNTYILYLYNMVNNFLPETRSFAFRRFILNLAGAKVGDGVKICASAKIIGNGGLYIKDDSWIGPGVFISTNHPSTVNVGCNVDIAPFVKIITGSHEYGSKRRVAGQGFSESITIGNGSWIGANSLILHGVIVGNGSLIAANSTIISDVPDCVLIAGVRPSIKKRFNCL